MPTHEDCIDKDTVLYWFRRDLRIQDNAGLYYALKEGNVVPIFIFDQNILNDLEDKKDVRVNFIYQTIADLKKEFETSHSSLFIYYGDPVQIFSSLNAKAVYTNHDYEPYARKRDKEVESMLLKRGIYFHSFKDQVIFEKSEVVKEDGDPYTVFTPYSKKWKATLNKFYEKAYPTESYIKRLKKIKPQSPPTLADIGFEKTDIPFPERVIKRSIIKTYDKTRDIPSLKGTSRLSVHLRFGTISIRTLIKEAKKLNSVWLNELIWREFYMMILWHFPHVEHGAFKPAYNKIKWRNNEKEFEAWCNGVTGYPIVDAGMRELNATGYMHNRVRMITASFLTKHLLIDWRWGEAYFAQKLLDFDLSANNGGWQWSAGSGCDAAPYFRVFNPALQTKKFDPQLTYIKNWIPEINTDAYPKPIVEHKVARERVLKVYKKALKGDD